MANIYDNDPFNEFFIKFIMAPLFGIMLFGYIYDSFFTKELNYGNYEWETYEERYKAEQEKERKWARENGVEWKLYNLQKPLKGQRYPNEYLHEDRENAEPESSLFREYMEELDNRGIDPGSPEAVEIWETYYK